MKILFEKSQNNVADFDLSKSPDLEHFDEELLTKNILFKSLSFGKNSKGQYVLGVECPSHKYLDFESGISYCLFGFEIGDKFDHVRLRAETFEKGYDKELGFFAPLCSVTIILQPQTQQEADGLKFSRVVTLPLKYEFRLLFVPLEDFDSINFEQDDAEVESDMIYEFD